MFDAGIAIVILAIVLDRLTEKVSERLDPRRSGALESPRSRAGAHRWRARVSPAIAVVVGLLALRRADVPERDLGSRSADP